MLLNPPSPSDESGTTMVELIVGMAMGMVVLVGLTLTIIVVMHGTARVDARVEATDNARTVVTAITEELHSACTSVQIAPVRAESNATTLIFWHAARGEGNAVVPRPVKTKIVYSGGKLTQTDYAQVGGTNPTWTFEGEGGNTGTGKTRTLLTNVAPGTEGKVFTYFRDEKGTPVPLGSPLSTEKAEETILVNVSLTASPRSAPVADNGSAATVSDTATFLLTPPSFEPEATAPPCK